MPPPAQLDSEPVCVRSRIVTRFERARNASAVLKPETPAPIINMSFIRRFYVEPLIPVKSPFVKNRWLTVLPGVMLESGKPGRSNRLIETWHQNMASKFTGFTLIELMVTIAVAAVLLTVAVPNFVVFLQNSRLVSQANELSGMLNFARSEAVKRSSVVRVCSRLNDATCAGGLIWDAGYLVFLDPDGNGTPDDAADVLRVRTAMEGNNTLRAGRAAIVFQANGFSAGSNTTFQICDARGTASGRAVVINNQGRTRASTVAGEGGACP